MNLVDALMGRCSRMGWTRKPAFFVDDRIVAHGEVYDRARRFASMLSSIGVPTAGRVVIAVHDSLEFVWSFLGTVLAGRVAVPVNPDLPLDDLARLAEESGATLVVADAPMASGGLRHYVAAEDLDRRLVRERSDPVSGVETEPAYAQTTSGTTGPPRIVVHRHSDPRVFNDAFGRPVLGLRPGDVVFSASKLFFAYGLGNSLFYPLMSGAAAVLLPGRASADVTAEVVESYGVSVLFGVPTLYARMLAGGHDASLRRLRLAITAGESLPPVVERGFAEATSAPLLNSLGCTEVGQAFTSNRGDARRFSSVGRALPPYTVQIVGDDDCELPVDEEGRIRVCGPTLPMATLEGGELIRNRGLDSLTTTDLGFRDSDGFLHYTTRADNVQVVGGLKVRPEPIEDTLTGQEGVVEAAVAAVRDPTGVTRLAAYVVAPGKTDDQHGFASGLRDSVAADHPAHEVPRLVLFVDALPRTATGKLQRFALQDTYESARAANRVP